MSKESTNVELKPITVVGGEVITDTERTTDIPPKGKLNKDSDPKEQETVVIKLGGKWPPEKATDIPEKDENDRDI